MFTVDDVNNWFDHCEEKRQRYCDPWRKKINSSKEKIKPGSAVPEELLEEWERYLEKCGENFCQKVKDRGHALTLHKTFIDGSNLSAFSGEIDLPQEKKRRFSGFRKALPAEESYEGLETWNPVEEALKKAKGPLKGFENCIEIAWDKAYKAWLTAPRSERKKVTEADIASSSNDRNACVQQAERDHPKVVDAAGLRAMIPFFDRMARDNYGLRHRRPY